MPFNIDQNSDLVNTVLKCNALLTLRELKGGEKTIRQITAQTDIERGIVIYHLLKLESKGIVKREHKETEPVAGRKRDTDYWSVTDFYIQEVRPAIIRELFD